MLYFYDVQVGVGGKCPNVTYLLYLFWIGRVLGILNTSSSPVTNGLQITFFGNKNSILFF